MWGGGGGAAGGWRHGSLEAEKTLSQGPKAGGGGFHPGNGPESSKLGLHLALKDSLGFEGPLHRSGCVTV